MRLSDPRIAPLTSITRVEVSPDLSLATIHVSVHDDAEARRKLTVVALQSAAGRLRRELSGQLETRTLPHLVFRLDESLRRGFETQQAIDRALEASGIAPSWQADAENAADEASNEPDAAGPPDDGDAGREREERNTQI